MFRIYGRKFTPLGEALIYRSETDLMLSVDFIGTLFNMFIVQKYIFGDCRCNIDPD